MVNIADQFVDEEFAGSAGGEELGAAVSERIEYAGIYERFEGLAVHGAGKPLHEVENVGKRPVRLPFGNYSVGNVAAEALETAEAEADVTALVY